MFPIFAGCKAPTVHVAVELFTLLAMFTLLVV